MGVYILSLRAQWFICISPGSFPVQLVTVSSWTHTSNERCLYFGNSKTANRWEAILSNYLGKCLYSAQKILKKIHKNTRYIDLLVCQRMCWYLVQFWNGGYSNIWSGSICIGCSPVSQPGVHSLQIFNWLPFKNYARCEQILWQNDRVMCLVFLGIFSDLSIFWGSLTCKFDNFHSSFLFCL